MTGRTAVVTGIGLYNKAGSRDAVFKAVDEGRSLWTLTELPEAPGLPSFFAVAAPPPPVRDYLTDQKMTKFMSPAAAMAVTAAGEALVHAGLFDDVKAKASMGLYVAVSMTAFDLRNISPAVAACRRDDGTVDFSKIGDEGFSRCHPLMPFKILANMPLGLVSIAFGIKGDSFILYPSADQGAACFDAALRGIQSGRLTRALVGGAGQGVGLLPVSTLHRLGRSAGVEYGRAGYAPADGAAFLVLESKSVAEARGAAVLAVLDDVVAGCAPSDTPPFEDCYGELAGTGSFDRIVSTGHLDDGARQREAATLAKLGLPCDPSALSHPDRILGQAAAATLPLSAALAVHDILTGVSTGAVAACFEPDGRFGGLRLSATVTTPAVLL